MTWVVGTPTLFGYAILVSDIRVTFTAANGQKYYVDGLQKVYPLSKSMLGGFAGSVKIGFRMLAELQYESAKVPQDSDWVLDIIANTWWPRLARSIFRSSEITEQGLGSHVILAAAHPSKNMGEAPYPQTNVYSFSSPTFEPRKGAYREILSIGSPDNRYVKAIDRLVSDFVFMQAAMAGEFGQGSMLAHALKREIAEIPLPGVSPIFQVGTVSRKKCAINNFIEGRVKTSGETEEDRFPPLACSYDEFVQISQANGFRVQASLC